MSLFHNGKRHCLSPRTNPAVPGQEVRTLPQIFRAPILAMIMFSAGLFALDERGEIVLMVERTRRSPRASLPRPGSETGRSFTFSPPSKNWVRSSRKKAGIILFWRRISPPRIGLPNPLEITGFKIYSWYLNERIGGPDRLLVCNSPTNKFKYL